MTKLVDLTAQTTIADLDVSYRVDVSDTTDDPGGSSKQITHANERTQSDTWRSPPTVAALATLGSAHVNGDVVFIKGYAADGDGGHGHFWLDTSEDLGAGAANSGTVFATDGSPADSYWRRLPDETEYDIRKWGGKIGTTAGDAAANDAAISAMIAAKMPIIFLPGTVVISKTVKLIDQPITILGTTPSDIDAGGFLVTGTDTAQTTAVIEMINNQLHRIENVRLYGHDSAPTTKCEVGVRLASDDGAGADYQLTRTVISNNLFDDAVKGVLTFKNGIKLDFDAGEKNTDQVLIHHNTLRGITEKYIWLENLQSVNTWLHHNTLDSQQSRRQGAHDGSDEATVLTDSGESFTVDQFVGLTILNETDGSSAVITANTATTITGALGGGTEDDWDIGDLYTIKFPEVGIYTNADVRISETLFNRLDRAIFTTNNILVESFHSEHVVTLVRNNEPNTHIVVRDGKFNFNDDAYTGQTDAKLMDNCRTKYLEMRNIEFLNIDLDPSERPIIDVGNHPSTVGTSTIIIEDCDGIFLDDIDAGTDEGKPPQSNRRLALSDHGTVFRYRQGNDVNDLTDYISCEKFLGGGFFNLD